MNILQRDKRYYHNMMLELKADCRIYSQVFCYLLDNKTERDGIMKKEYLISLFVACTLLMMGCSNQQKDSATDPDAPAVTDSTGLTEGEADIAGQGTDMGTGSATVDGQNDNTGNGTTAGNGQSDSIGNGTTAGNGQSDSAGNGTTAGNGQSAVADTTGSPAVTAGKKSTTTKNSDKTENESKKETSSSSQTKDIGMEAAKKIALGKAGLTEQDGSWKEEKRDKENGRIVYELEFVSGNVEYEFEINAKDGKILEYKQDPIDD